MKTKNIINYKEIDVEFRNLVKALNEVPGFTTNSCCQGHGKYEGRIWFKCDSIYALNLFMWAMCHRWGLIWTIESCGWEVVVDNGDTDANAPYLSLMLVTKIGSTKKECDVLARQINKWLKVERIITNNFKEKRAFCDNDESVKIFRKQQLRLKKAIKHK